MQRTSRRYASAAATAAALLLAGCGGAGALRPAPTPTAASQPAGPPAAPKTLDAVDFLDARTGWVAGQEVAGHGVLLHTTDGGATWVHTGLAGDAPLALHMEDGEHGWMVAETGCGGFGCTLLSVLGTADGGARWRVQWQAPIDTQVMMANMLVRSQVEAFGPSAYALALGHLVATTDSGRVWHALTLPQDDTPVDAAFVGARHGWVAAERCAGQPGVDVAGGTTAAQCRPIVYATTDGGHSWNAAFVPALVHGYTTGSAAVSFADARHGWLFFKNGSLQGQMYRTTDGGATWNLVNDTVASARTISGHPVFVSAQDGWMPVDEGAAPFPGALWATADGGRTWTDVSQGKDWSIRAVDAVGTPTVLWAISDQPNFANFLARSDDGGRTWQQVLPTLAPVAGISFADDQNGMGIGSASNPKTVLVTADGGAHWTETASLGAAPAAIAERSTSDALIVADTLLKRVVLRSTDGGRTWRQVADVTVDPSQGTGAASPYLADFASHALLQTLDFPQIRIAASPDEGRAWTAVGSLPKPPGATATVAFANPQVGYVALQSGAVLIEKTIDGGRSWTAVNELQGTLLPDAMSFTDATHGILLVKRAPVGGQPTLALMTTGDGGATWSTAPLDAPASDLQTLLNLDPGAVFMTFADASHGWIVSRDGTMLRTTDGGASWSRP